MIKKRSFKRQPSARRSNPKSGSGGFKKSSEKEGFCS